MWNFIKNVFAVVLGLFLFLLLSVFLMIAIVGISTNKETASIESQSILKLKFDKEIVERESEKLFSGMGIIPSGSSIGLMDLKEAIKTAKEDENIKGIFLDLSTVQAGFASLEEIRLSLLDFKKSNKFIVAYSENYSEGAYYLASVADKIYLPPSGSLEFNGLESEVLFFKGALEKLDIKVEVFKVGSFKSAVEPFLLDKMSDPSRLQINSFMNSIYDVFLTNISASRAIEKQKLKLISDSMLVRNAADAFSYKLVTDLAYYAEVEKEMKRLSGTTGTNKLNFIDYASLLKETNRVDKKADTKIAVIFANGEIISGKGNDDVIGSETLSAQLRKAREDSSVKAIVLRINSPGGSALASDVIWNEVVLTRAVKPIIASMSDVAASGGYYIAMACDTIVAQPNTITGSIGVFGLALNAEVFLKEKLGITTDRVKTGTFSDIGSSTRGLTAYEKKMIQKEVEGIYEDFTLKASQGRKMTQSDLKKYAEGRVWSGKEALEINLVDTLGGISESIAIAKRMAGVNDYTVVYWPEQKNIFWKDLLSGLGDEENAKEEFLKSELGFIFPYIRSIKDIQKLNGVQARMPYKLVIK